MTPEQNSYLQQVQERRDARAQMPGPNESAGPAPTPGRMMTQAVPENGGGIEDIRMSTQAVGEEGGGGTQRPSNDITRAMNENGGGTISNPGPGMATTMAIPEGGGGGAQRPPNDITRAMNENGGGGIRDGLGPNQQRRFDKRMDRHQRRHERAGRRASRDLRRAEANGANNFEMMGRAMHHNNQAMDRDVAFTHKMNGYYVQNGDGGATTGASMREKGGGGARPNPTLDRLISGPNVDHWPGMGGGGGSGDIARPNFPGMPGFAPPKADGGGKPKGKINKPKADGTGGLHTDKKWSQLSKSERKEVKSIHGDNAKNSFQQQRAKSMGYENEQAKKDDFALKRKVASGEATHAETRAAGMGSNQQRRAANRAEREKRRAKKAEAQKFKNKKQKRITGKDEMPYN